MPLKKLLTLFCLFLFCKVSVAQKIWDREFKPFRMDFSTGYAMPKGTDVKAGPLFSVEPRYAFTGDAFTFGFRIEGAMLKVGQGTKSVGDTLTINTDETNANLSGSITCDYFFSNNMIRPFIGAGPGFYSVAVATGKDEGALLPTYDFTNKFGFMVRGGAEWQHLRISGEYNFISTVNNSISGYLGVKIGIFLGGGRFDLISGNDNPF